MRPQFAAAVVAAKALAELRQLRPAGIIEQPQAVAVVVEGPAAPQAALHHLDRLAVARHQHIHPGLAGGLLGDCVSRDFPLGRCQGEKQLQEAVG